jgi:uncharacterized repeat protein (TIGR02543 family)
VFNGWHKEAEAVTVWDFDTDTITANTTLYAGWTPVWTVVFNSQQGSAIEPLAGVVNGAVIAKPAPDPTRTGFSFAGWYKETAGTNVWNFTTDTVTANTTLYARWIPVYTVAFDSRDGSAVGSIENVLSGAVIAQPANPTLAGCSFEGWYREAAYTNRWNFAADTVTANITLYAKWTVTVSFDAQGGSPVPAQQTLTRGSLIADRPGDPVTTGMTFMGWHKEAAGTTAWDFAADRVNANTTLYAKWEFVAVTDIVNGPEDGIIGEALNIGSAAVTPSNASYKTITWSVKTAGAGITTGATAPFTPSALGSLTLTATVANGLASGAYTEEFPIKVTTIREVTGISINDMPDQTDHLARGFEVDLNKVTITPANATNKTIVWTVASFGAGINAIPGNKKIVLLEAGTLTLTATIVDGREDTPGTLNDFTQNFSFTVDRASVPGGVGFGDGTSIKLYANGDTTTPLSAEAPIRVTRTSDYYITIDAAAGYANIVWYLNGHKSTVSGGKLYLDTAKKGTVTVAVEVEKGGVKDDSVYTFIIE